MSEKPKCLKKVHDEENRARIKSAKIQREQTIETLKDVLFRMKSEVFRDEERRISKKHDQTLFEEYGRTSAGYEDFEYDFFEEQAKIVGKYKAIEIVEKVLNEYSRGAR